jgi:hypothetical protein
MTIDPDRGLPPSIAFVFGAGWWRIWHWILIALALPIIWFADWFAHYDPGGGPQGGEAVFLLMLIHMLVYMVATVVSAALQARYASGTLLQRCFTRPAIMVTAWLAGCALVWLATDVGTTIDATPVVRWSAVAIAVVAVLLVYGANFWALALGRRG